MSELEINLLLPIIFGSAICFMITVILIPLIINLSTKFNILDNPNKRKQHDKPLSRLGGIPIIVSFILSIAFISLYSNLLNIRIIDLNVLMPIAIASSASFTLGAIDDIYDISASVRLVFQIFISMYLINSGVKVESLDMSWVDPSYYNIVLPNHLSIIISVILLVGTCNALNWIDGLDGLASGLTLISSCSILLGNLTSNSYTILFIAITLIGILLGFLKYNFYPASIHMGDGGSYFLGSIMGCLLIIANSNNLDQSITVTSTHIILLTFFVPYIDMFYVLFSRLINKSSLIEPDRSHLHHKLMDIGLSHKSTVLIICFYSIITSSISLIFKVKLIHLLSFFGMTIIFYYLINKIIHEKSLTL
tara:strand:+ start:1952 stop:3043 length:1092 start_codon:yes stop_codon:yes gene_type:complete